MLFDHDFLSSAGVPSACSYGNTHNGAEVQFLEASTLKKNVILGHLVSSVSCKNEDVPFCLLLL